MRAHLAQSVLVIVVLFGAASCSASSDGEHESVLPPDLRSVDLRQIGATSQLQALEDGSLSFYEYERALTAFIGCLRAEGLRFRREPTIDEHGRLRYELFAGQVKAEVERTNALVERCEFEHTSILNRVWAWEEFRSSEREIAETRRVLAACLRERGLEAPEVPTDQDLSTLLAENYELFSECAQRALDATGASGF